MSLCIPKYNEYIIVSVMCGTVTTKLENHVWSHATVQGGICTRELFHSVLYSLILTCLGVLDSKGFASIMLQPKYISVQTCIFVYLLTFQRLPSNSSTPGQVGIVLYKT